MPKATKFIIVIQAKGGVGKTTVTHALASAISDNGGAVAVVDQDTQESSLQWAGAAEHHGRPLPYPVYRPEEFIKLKERPAYVIIDAPGNNLGALKALVPQADVILMPTLPGPLEADSLARTIAVMQGDDVAFKDGAEVGVICVKWRRAGTGNDTAVCLDTQARIEEMGLPILAKLYDKSDYQKRFGRVMPFHLYHPLKDVLDTLGVRA